MTLLADLKSRLTAKSTTARESAEVIWRKYASELAKGDHADPDRLADLVAQLGLTAEVACVHAKAIERAAELEAQAKQTADAEHVHVELEKQMGALFERRQKINDELAHLHAKQKQAERDMKTHATYVEMLETLHLRMPGLFALPLNAEVPGRLQDHGIDCAVTTVARELGVTIPVLGSPWPAGAGAGDER